MAKLFSVVAYAYTFLVVIASLGKIASLGVFPENVKHSDKIGHFIAYAGFAFVWGFFFVKSKKYRSCAWAVVIWYYFCFYKKRQPQIFKIVNKLAILASIIYRTSYGIKKESKSYWYYFLPGEVLNIRLTKRI